MSYKSLRAALSDLERTGQLIRINTELDPDLEMAEVHRRFYDAGGAALWFQNVKGSPFTAASNLYGTKERTRFLFRHTLERVQKVIELKADFGNFFKKPSRYLGTPFTALNGLPKKPWFSKPILYGETTIDKLPAIKSWGMDGGAFVTLPQVCTMPLDSRDIMKSNIGMYRIQLTGNDYETNKEIGLHYQLHRGIGVHHTQYNASQKPFKASIFVGGAPSHAFSAIMPLPEGLSEMTFAGLLNGRRFRYFFQDDYVLSAEADFCILGEIEKNKTKREGPFGDHLGYYSLEHQFPVMTVKKVYHRKDAVWHFTVVGRPPQEDTSFGYLIHELVRELTPKEFPGLKEVHAVDAAGVHPLLLAIGQERYMPFRDKKPEEILTIANRLIGSGQTSLTKYLIIAADGDAPNLHTHDIADFFSHVLARADWRRDLHFQTRTTIDTLDYSGSGWNEGSKLIIAACGQPIRQLATQMPTITRLTDGFSNPKLAGKGILAINAPKFANYTQAKQEIEELISALEQSDLSQVPLIVLCDDSDFVADTLNNFLWVTFTRSNPSHDIYGIGSGTSYKHWGCTGSLIIDARIKQHHAPVLEVDAKVKAKVDKLFSKGGELYGKIGNK
jgi:4-hydroxy-3-polyprenylbenzoate decarboxylase